MKKGKTPPLRMARSMRIARSTSLSLDKEDLTLMVRHNWNDKDLAFMHARGVQKPDMLFGKRSFYLPEVVTSFQNDTGQRVKEVKATDQMKYIKRMMLSPLDGIKCMAISSTPSDLMAKQLAIWFFHRAMTEYQQRLADGGRRQRSAPIWHRVFSGFGDMLLEGSERPAFLVISNVVEESTAVKFEKLRDLLEKFNDIPRIVVTGGVDPIELFRRRLHYPVDGAVYLSAGGMQNEADAETFS